MDTTGLQRAAGLTSEDEAALLQAGATGDIEAAKRIIASRGLVWISVAPQLARHEQSDELEIRIRTQK